MNMANVTQRRQQQQQRRRQSVPIGMTKNHSMAMSLSNCWMLLSLSLMLFSVATTSAFVRPSNTVPTLASTLSSSSCLYSSLGKNPSQQAPRGVYSEEEADQIKQEIAKLKAEAQQRLQALNEQLTVQENTSAAATATAAAAASNTNVAKVTASTSSSAAAAAATAEMTPTPTTKRLDIFEEAAMEIQESKELFEKRMERDHAFLEQEKQKQTTNSNNPGDSTTITTTPTIPKNKSTSSTTTTVKTDVDLLDNTRWRLMLNVGREPGTWMPKTWGVSGERLLLNMEVEFDNEPVASVQNYDEFLNGYNHVKTLKVVHNEATMAPNMKEGGRRGLRVSNGAWRVAPGDGPMGTSVLRFYLELHEELRHQGSDVYCPAGRIYCTCGYFPMKKQKTNNGTTVVVSSKKDGSSSSKSKKDNEQKTAATIPEKSRKELLRQEQMALNVQYQKLQQEDELDTSMNFIQKMKRMKQMMDLRVEANKLTQQMNVLQIQEPDKAVLRLSQDQTVGLTREGGICCKVPKGLAMEYHILGKFEIASMKNVEHSDYRDLLSP